jgi:hypothetical protein
MNKLSIADILKGCNIKIFDINSQKIMKKELTRGR